MSSSFVDALASAQAQLYRYGGTFLIVAGDLGGIFNLIMFLQPSLRWNPCSAYFLAYAGSNLIYINFSMILTSLREGFHVDPSVQSLGFCRLRVYMYYVFTVLPTTLLIMVTIDRTFISLLTYRNIREMNRHIMPVVNEQPTSVEHRMKVKDQQLIVMLLSQVLVTIVCIIPFTGYRMYSQITQNQPKAAVRQSIESFVQASSVFVNYIPACINFYVYTWTTRTFRNQVKRVLIKLFQC
ncbi:unnamed protein product [Didymodactylos carnosus]|uniref:G-protein coupled receptors family 1 profile domain-containing protein n=1 Tax=Didymodactylos carnosus TaxID=1234261 RepID=A0A815FU78_9BILA|nr:unnamed protein product [Didymodactylos carnosus]CAF1325200.1 unnamed protein product [Didymodactylos carnosus]CAF4011882.1 unnamed protein product [Didymodactylos carnosus]CAF4174368.1 unnamed protein product [Didymodactylos carnosus]